MSSGTIIARRPLSDVSDILVTRDDTGIWSVHVTRPNRVTMQVGQFRTRKAALRYAMLPWELPDASTESTQP